MRITNGMMQASVMNSLYGNMNSMNKLYEQMSTMKKIQRPSDDPIIAGRSLKLRLNVLETEQHERNVQEATSWMDITETALSNMQEILKDIRTRCNQAANDSLTADDRKKIKEDIVQLYKQLQLESNTTYAGRYVFSGYKTDKPMFLTEDTALKEDITLTKDIILGGDMTLVADVTFPDGTVAQAGTVIPKGTSLPAGTEISQGNVLPKETMNPEVAGNIDGHTIHYEIGVGNTIEVNTIGVDALMGNISRDISDIIEALDNPNADLNQVFTGKLAAFDERLSEVSSLISDLGSRQTRLDYTESRLVDDKTNFTELLGETENVDIEQVFTDFNSQYMVYQSALQAASKLISNTLGDYLR